MTKVKIGDSFPDFVFNTNRRDNVHVSDVLKERTVFWVLRYIGCTVCRYDVHQIALNYQKFQDLHTQVFVVMQSDQKHVNDDLKKTDESLPFEIICDPDQRIYDLLSIDPAESKEALAGNALPALKEKGRKASELGIVHGDYEGNELQLPAMFIVEKNGIVSYAHYAANIMDMPDVDELTALLKNLPA